MSFYIVTFQLPTDEVVPYGEKVRLALTREEVELIESSSRENAAIIRARSLFEDCEVISVQRPSCGPDGKPFVTTYNPPLEAPFLPDPHTLTKT